MRFAILFLTCGLAFAQLETNTLTITASRNVSVVPDQVLYGVSLTTDLSATLDDAIAQLAGTGITAANFTYVTSSGDSAKSVDWAFELVVPFSKMKDTVAALSGLRTKLGVRNTSRALTFSAVTERTSSDAQSQGCPLTSLVNDARREAERIAAAAGVRLGGIVGLSDGSGSNIPTAANRIGGSVAAFYPAFGVPVGGFGLISFLPGPVTARPSGCALMVQFRLLP
jgi:hypothetical protein